MTTAARPWDEYIAKVLAGDIVACEWVKLACKRHLSDLETGADRGFYFDADAAARAIEFFSFLKHSKGAWAGQVVRLELWQCFVVAMAYGWRKIANKQRRFKYVYLEVARKNGKTTLAAGIGLELLLADGEGGAEVYTAATKRDQARIAHEEATRMVKASPYLRKRAKIVKDNILIDATASKFIPLGRDADSLDGLNVHGAVIDELHAHPNRELFDVIDTATGARTQPLIFMITTAGSDRQSICFEFHTHTEQVLNGAIVDDSFFGVVYTLDKGDDWRDETTWIKANPNLGVSKYLDNLRDKAERAAQIATQQNNFLTKELNVWTQSETKWLDFDKWQRCNHPIGDMRGRVCYGGLDLSSNTDISALVLVFPPQTKNDKWAILPRFWIPDESMAARVKRDRVPYDVWARAGFIATTPGEVVDYEYILEQVKEDAEAFDFKELAYDRWGAPKLANDIQRVTDVALVQFGQGFQSMSGPMKELERMILSGALAHAGNPVLAWMADNLVASADPAGNIKPDKEKSREKIDGIVALIMALDRATRHHDSGPSVYESRGIRFI